MAAFGKTDFSGFAKNETFGADLTAELETRMDRLRAMEVFVGIVETGSLSGAAKQLHMANASVTTLLRQLEAQLGVVLVQRSTRHVRITEEGADYYERCKAILAQVVEAQAALGGSLAVLRGVLHLQMPIAFGHLMLGPALADFAAEHSNLRIIANLTNEIDSFIKSGIDVAVRMDEVESGELVARPVYRSPHVLCAAPAFLANYGTPRHPRDIGPKHCLGFMSHPDGALRHWNFRKGTELHTVVPAGNLFFNSSDALMQTAVRGSGMIYILDILAQRYCASGDLVRILEDWQTDSQTFYAVYPKTRFTPAKVRAFIDFLLRIFPPQDEQEATRPVRVRSR
jgi:LysR family transcriptional regulator, regulator for bpeEF and oprC